MKRVAGLIAVGCLLVISCKKNNDNSGNSNMLSSSDSTFIRMAAMSNFAEISAGRIAATKAQDSGIVRFAQTMVTDHTNASRQLDSVARQAGAGTGLTADSLDNAHTRLRDSLNTLNGRGFDSVYVMSQVRDHQTTIALFQNEASNGQHQQLRQFATNMIPELQMHLQMADSLSTNLGR